MQRIAGWPKPRAWGVIGVLLIVGFLCMYYLTNENKDLGAQLFVQNNAELKMFTLRGFVWEMPVSWLEDASESVRGKDLIVFRDENNVIKMSLVCPYVNGSGYDLWELVENKSRIITKSVGEGKVEYRYYKPKAEYSDQSDFVMIFVSDLNTKTNCQLTIQSAEASLSEINAIYESIKFDSKSN